MIDTATNMQFNALGMIPSQFFSDRERSIGMEAHPARTFGFEDAEAEAGAGAMLLACRLAGLSALEAHYAGVIAHTQDTASPCRLPHRTKMERPRCVGEPDCAPEAVTALWLERG